MLGRAVGAREVLAIGDGMLTDVKGAADNGIDVLYVSGGIHARDYGDAASPIRERSRPSWKSTATGRSPSCRGCARRWHVGAAFPALVRRDAPLPADLRGGVVAIGNFDGVHRGHQAVLERALARGQAPRRAGAGADLRAASAQSVPARHAAVRADAAADEGAAGRDLGFAALVEQPFTRDFAAVRRGFRHRRAGANLGISHAVTGFDFHFGKNRQGGPAFLMAAGERHGFGVTLVDAFRDEGAEVVSSSRIRALLGEGEVAEAAGLLGYRFTVEAEVIGGQQLGRTLGFPTANMRLPASHRAQARHLCRPLPPRRRHAA